VAGDGAKKWLFGDVFAPFLVENLKGKLFPARLFVRRGIESFEIVHQHFDILI
jgi:hypothetical protein